MRDYQLQTPQKDHAAANRRPKLAVDRNKKSLKASQKNLNPEFSFHATAAFGFGSPKDSIDSSSVVENSGENLLDDLSEGFTGLMTPAAASTTTSEVVNSSDVSPLPSIITPDEPKYGTGSTSGMIRTVKESVTKSCVEMEIVLKILRETQIQVTRGKTIDLQSKRILDAVLAILIEDITQLPVEKDWIDELMSKKGYVVLLSIVLWTLSIFVFLLSSSRGRISSIGTVPT